MDEYAVAAICAVPAELQGSDAERFFDLIIEICQDGTAPASLDELIPQIEQRDSGLATPAAQFLDNLRTQGLDQNWPGIARTLVSEAGTGSALATLRDQYTAQAAAGAAGGAPDWAAFRTQNVDFWSGWNGADWPTWRTAFARLVPAELRAETEPQLTYLDSLDPAGQLAYLRDTLGFTINQQALDYHQATGLAGEIPDGDTPAEEQLEAVATDVMDNVLAELPALADELGVSVQELQAELAALDPEDIANAIVDGVSGE